MEVEIKLKHPVCLPGISEDQLREFLDALEATVKQDIGDFPVTSDGVPVRFAFGSDGNFAGVYSTIAGKAVALIPGNGGSSMTVFKGSPSASNPGPGWEVEVDLTKQYLGQGPNPNVWKLFFASRKGIINVF